MCPPPEENLDLPGFTLERAHLLLQGVCGDYLHHNDRLHLDGGSHGRRFMAVLLAPACCTVINLVCHAIWSSRAPLHINLGCRMAGDYWQKLEL